MTLLSGEFPDLLVSLSIQSGLLLLITGAIAARAPDSASADRTWAFGQLVVLLQCFAAVFLPHVRLLPPDIGRDVMTRIQTESTWRTGFNVLAWVWLLGVFWQMTRTIWSLIATTLIVRRACSAGHPVPFSSQCPASAVSGTPVLYSDDVATPFCWQLHRRVVVLPSALQDFPPDELQVVVQHELAHLEAQHPLRLFLQRLLEAAFWFHPVVWWASRQASLQRELSSDFRALRSAADAIVLLRGMLRLKESCRSKSGMLAAGMPFLGAGSSMIPERTNQLLNRDWSAPAETLSIRRLSAAIVAAALLVSLIRIPLNADITGRTMISPWPSMTASALQLLGIRVRDYEVDSHRLKEHRHSVHVPLSPTSSGPGEER